MKRFYQQVETGIGQLWVQGRVLLLFLSVLLSLHLVGRMENGMEARSEDGAGSQLRQGDNGLRKPPFIAT